MYYVEVGNFFLQNFKTKQLTCGCFLKKKVLQNVEQKKFHSIVSNLTLEKSGQVHRTVVPSFLPEKNLYYMTLCDITVV